MLLSKSTASLNDCLENRDFTVSLSLFLMASITCANRAFAFVSSLSLLSISVLNSPNEHELRKHIMIINNKINLNLLTIISIPVYNIVIFEMFVVVCICYTVIHIFLLFRNN